MRRNTSVRSGSRKRSRTQGWTASVAVVLAVGLTGCSLFGDDEDSSATAADAGSTDPHPVVVEGIEDTTSTEPMCEQLGYPCTLREVDPEVGESTTIAAERAAAIASIDDLSTAAGWLADRDDVVEVTHDGYSLRFRLADGRPTWVTTRSVDGEPLDSIGGPPPDEVAVGSTDAPTVTPVSDGSEVACDDDNQAGCAGEHRRALILQPHAHQFGPEHGEELQRILRDGDGHFSGDGAVHLFRNDDAGDPMGAFEDAGYSQDNQAGSDPRDIEEPSQRGRPAGTVTLEEFRNWHLYDTVILHTHGRMLCADSADEDHELAGHEASTSYGCRTVLSTGLHWDLSGLAPWVEGADELDFDDDPGIELNHGTEEFRPQWEDGAWPDIDENEGDGSNANLPADERQKLATEACMDILLQPDYELSESDRDDLDDHCFGDEQPYVDVMVNAHFFKAEYEDGLPDQLIMLGACESMRHPDIANHLAGDGGRGAVFGFNRVVFTAEASPTREEFARQVADGAASSSIQEAIEEADETGALEYIHDGTGAILEAAPGDALEIISLVSGGGTTSLGHDRLRGRDTISAHHLDGEEFTDGDQVELVTGDDGPVLPARLQVVGIDPDDDPIDGFELTAAIDGEEVDARWELDEHVEERSTGTHVWETEVEIPVAADGGTFELEVASTVPGGGLTRWTYDLNVGTELLFEVDYVTGRPGESLIVDAALSATVPLEPDEGDSDDGDASDRVLTGSVTPTWDRVDLDIPSFVPSEVATSCDLSEGPIEGELLVEATSIGSDQPQVTIDVDQLRTDLNFACESGMSQHIEDVIPEMMLVTSSGLDHQPPWRFTARNWERGEDGVLVSEATPDQAPSGAAIEGTIRLTLRPLGSDG